MPLLLLLLSYPWLATQAVTETVERSFPTPAGFVRDAAPDDSFALWLRGLPLLPGRPSVRLFDGSLKWNQTAHAAIVDIDVGTRDLQQCADAVMRLRAEYLFAAGRRDEIAFRFTSGDLVPYARWAHGERPIVEGRRVRWTRSAASDDSHRALRAYLDVIFTYAGSRSLASELEAVPTSRMRAGDVFIQGGSPGHAVIVVDTATDATGRRAFLLAQSYMPAQQVHVLRNPTTGEAWYVAAPGSLQTPEWRFPENSLRRFREAR